MPWQVANANPQHGQFVTLGHIKRYLHGIWALVVNVNCAHLGSWGPEGQHRVNGDVHHC